jgi:hypothetical protein
MRIKELVGVSCYSKIRTLDSHKYLKPPGLCQRTLSDSRSQRGFSLTAFRLGVLCCCSADTHHPASWTKSN